VTENRQAEECRSQVILKPIVIALLPFILTIPVACIFTAHSLKRMSATGKTLFLLISAGIIFILQLWFLWNYDTSMWVIIAVWSGSSITAGFVLYLFYRPTFRQYKATQIPLKPSKFEFTGLLAGMISGGSAGLFLLFLLAAILSIAADYFLSTLVPVNFSMEVMRVGFMICGFFGICCGTVLGGITGCRFNSESSVSLYKLTAGFLISSSWLIILSYLMVLIPAYQITRTFGEKAPGPGFIMMGWFCSIVFVVYSSLIIVRSINKRSMTERSLLIGLAAVGFGVSFTIYSSLLPYDFFLLGKNMENRVKLEFATRCYEKSLIRQSNDRIQSFLKYRMSLLQHKNGNTETAKEGFQAVVSKYNADKELVKKATGFLRNLEHAAPDAKRIVISGVETDTEHKINYCAPNSYALNYRYWGLDISPKEVGQMFVKGDAGTALIDAFYHTKNLGLEAYFSSLMTLDEIKSLIDHNIPVLVFIPRHVFVIFGYDETLQTFISYDTASKELWIEYPMEEFKKSWILQFNMSSILLPENQIGNVPGEILEKYKKSTQSIIHYYLAYHQSSNLLTAHNHNRLAIELNPDLYYIPIQAMSSLPLIAHEIPPLIDADSVIEGTREFLDIDPKGNRFNTKICSFLLSIGRPEEARIFLESLETKWELSTQLQNRQAVYEYLSGSGEAALQRIKSINDDAHMKLDYLAGYLCEVHETSESAKYYYKDFLEYISYRYEEVALRNQEGYFDAKAADYLLKNPLQSGNQDMRSSYRNYLEFAPYNLPVVMSLALNLAESADEDDRHEAERLFRKVVALSENPELLKTANQQLEILDSVKIKD